MVRRAGSGLFKEVAAAAAAKTSRVGEDQEPLDPESRHQQKLCDLARKVPMPRKTGNEQLYQQVMLERQALANTIDLLWKNPHETYECHAWLMNQIYNQDVQGDETWDESYTLWSRALGGVAGVGARAKGCVIGAKRSGGQAPTIIHCASQLAGCNV